MPRPELKQLGDISRADFDRHPVWIASHVADYDEAWYDETDEETVRPWTGDLPVSSSNGMFLVRASFKTADGSHYRGFVTPAFEQGDLATMQPEIFVGPKRFSFWGGTIGVDAAERRAFYAAMGKEAVQVFPLRFDVEPHLATGVVAGQVDGFYRLNRPDMDRLVAQGRVDPNSIVIER